MTATDISIADVHHHLCEAMVALAQIVGDVGPDDADDLFEAARHISRSAEHMLAFRRAAKVGIPALPPDDGSQA